MQILSISLSSFHPHMSSPYITSHFAICCCYYCYYIIILFPLLFTTNSQLKDAIIKLLLIDNIMPMYYLKNVFLFCDFFKFNDSLIVLIHFTTINNFTHEVTLNYLSSNASSN